MGAGTIITGDDALYTSLLTSWLAQGRPRNFWYNGQMTGTPYTVINDSTTPYFIEQDPTERDLRDKDGRWGKYKYLGPVKDQA